MTRRMLAMRMKQPFLDRLQRVLAQNCSKHHFGVAQMGISERHLQRRIGQLAGHGPAQYLQVYRLRMSLDYLRGGRQIGDVARAVGFKSHAYFTSCFKAKYGTTPTRFRLRFYRASA